MIIVKANQEILILGDLNARVGNESENCYGVIGKEGENETSTNGEMLLDCCIRNNLKIANTFFKHKNIHKWTRVQEERNERSIIDYIIVSNSLFYDTQDVRVKRGAEIYSDHYLVVGIFKISPKCKVQRQNLPKRSKLKLEELKNANIKTLFQNSIKSKLEEWQTHNECSDDIEVLWSKYKEIINCSANEVCGRKIIGGSNKRTAWWNDAVKLKVKEKKEAWKKYLTTKSNEDKEAYKTKKNGC